MSNGNFWLDQAELDAVRERFAELDKCTTEEFSAKLKDRFPEASDAFDDLHFKCYQEALEFVLEERRAHAAEVAELKELLGITQE